VALTKAIEGNDVMMGDLVLLQEEVNPVMSALLENGLEVTALHNHFFWEEPRIFFMHIHGHGKALDLPACQTRAGSHPRATAASVCHSLAAPAGPAFNLVALETSLAQGEALGSVYKSPWARRPYLKEHGAAINARMGLNSWAPCRK